MIKKPRVERVLRVTQHAVQRFRERALPHTVLDVTDEQLEHALRVAISPFYRVAGDGKFPLPLAFGRLVAVVAGGAIVTVSPPESGPSGAGQATPTPRSRTEIRKRFNKSATREKRRARRRERERERDGEA